MEMTKAQAALVVTALEVLSGDMKDGFYFGSVQEVTQSNYSGDGPDSYKPDFLNQMLLAFPQLIGVTELRDVGKYDLAAYVDEMAAKVAKAHGLRSTYGDEYVNSLIDTPETATV